MEREKVNIKGFDDMLKGGIPKGAVIGISGPPGVGKSIFNLHFLLAGAKKGQKCVYICLEEPRENIDRMINEFSFAKEFFNYEKKGKIVIKCFTYPEYEKIYSELLQKIQQDDDIERLVIDSFNCFFATTLNPETMSVTNEANLRRMITNAFSAIRRKNLTTMLVLEMQPDHRHGFYYNIPYLVDGIINLDFLELGTIERRIFIPKMRWTDQYKESKSYEISESGIVINEEKEDD